MMSMMARLFFVIAGSVRLSCERMLSLACRLASTFTYRSVHQLSHVLVILKLYCAPSWMTACAQCSTICRKRLVPVLQSARASQSFLTPKVNTGPAGTAVGALVWLL